MDNLTHSLTGWALGQTGLKTKSRKGLAALILGANMPDIDVFFFWVPWDALAIHRGVTHSLVGGSIVMPPILAGLLWLLDRWQVGRGTKFKSGLSMHFGWLVGLSYIGAVSHPLMDVLTTYSVQLLSPFSNAWYHADGLFIIDVWLWILLGTAIFWSKRLEKRGGEWRKPAQGAIGVLLFYVAVNMVISQRAWSEVQGWAGGRQVDAIFASPPPFYSWRRDLVWRESGCYRRAYFDPFAGFGRVGACEPSNMQEPLVREAIRQSPPLQKFLKWSILPQAAVERSGCLAEVRIGDARYGRAGQSRLARTGRVQAC